MESSNGSNQSLDRTYQLEQMLRLYMHETTQVTSAIDITMKSIVHELENQSESDSVADKNNSVTLLKSKVERESAGIMDMLKMMNLLKNNIRVGMNLSQTDDDLSDVHIYRDIIFKLKDIYQFELDNKNLAFVTPPITFTADAKLSYKTSKNLLELVLYNVISNAVKFSHRDTNIYVECRQTSLLHEKRTITVDDYGVRIEESDRPYELFYRGAESAFSDKGTGLGLFVARQAIERLGGQIKHQCKLVSKYYVPYIAEYIKRPSDSKDEALVLVLHRELAHLKENNLFGKIVSHQKPINVTDEELQSNICIPTYETSFEVII